jgi:TP901 family phage tail tape measure protein
MSDVNANIKVSIDSSQALSELKSLQRQISLFHTNIAKSSAQAALAQRTLQTDLLNAINATGRFSAEMRTIKTSTEAFTNSLEKNKFSIRQYFRYAAGSTKTFGKFFRSEFDTIAQVAEDRVKKMQTQYIKMGRDANGAMRAMAITPKQLNMDDYSTKLQLAAQKQQLFNQLLKQGSTNLLNFGKNTQWAGRQLMVGFTLPLAMLGSTASKAFMDMETAAIKFRKVYGDLLTPKEETQAALDGINALANGYTKYGIAASQTVSLAADAAAAGFKGLDLQAQTEQATRLSVLGQIDQQKALETTIALQNAFQISSQNLADAINFLNSVENQTVLSLDDVTTAIPIAAPIIQSLGGDVKDLAFFMTAMKEGGINAAEGANALKSGLASIINPSGKAAEMLASVGINIRGIVEKNKGDLRATVLGVADALNTLRPLDRARAIEQLFGKFQFSRISTLFANIVNEGTQASRVLDLTEASMSDLATTADKELGITADSAMNKFKKTVEDLKVSLIPVGQAFLEAITPILETLNNILSRFKDMSDGSKKAITLLITVIGGLGPVLLMTFGLLANGLANILKLFGMLRGGYLKLGGQSQILGEQTQYLTSEQIDAAAVASSLDQTHARLTQTFNVERVAIDQLRNAYIAATGAALKFAVNNPGLMSTPKKYAKGISIVPGSGNKDSVPAMLMPGEAVIPTKMAKKYGPLIDGMIADNIPGFRKGLGTGTAVDVPGGFAAAHFGGSSQATGAQLIEISKGATQAVQNAILQMVNAFEDGMERRFTVFSNEVVATSTELNRAVGKTGSGKQVDKQIAMADLIGNAEVRDIELQRQLTAAGVPIEDIREINKKITTQIENGFTTIGTEIEEAGNEFGKVVKKTVVTAEDLDKLINDAYNEVAAVDERVAQARSRMKKITAVTDPRNDSRIAVSKDPYTKFRKGDKYFEGMEEMVGVGNVPYQKKARFKITNAVADSIGLSSANTADVYNQMSAEAKIALSKLKADVAAFTLEFEKQAELAGLKIGRSYKVGIDKISLKDIYVEARERNSPHPLAAKDGADDAVAYEKAKRNKLLTYGTTGPVSAIDKSIRRNNEKRLKDLSANMSVTGGMLGAYGLGSAGAEQTKQVKRSTANLQNMNNALMSGTFALTSLSAMGSMAGGKIGDLSQQVMKYSGALFALMSVTQLLTQTKITELAATRLSIARSATANAMAAGPMFGGASKSIFGKAGLFGALARGGLMVSKFLGPIGMAVGVTALLVTGFRKLQKAQEEAQRKVLAFGNALTTTQKQAESTGEYFGVTVKKSALETKFQTQAGKSDPTLQDKINQFKESDTFKKDYEATVKDLKNLNDSEAKTALLVRVQNLIGQGYSEEQIQIIISSLQEAAGKTGINLKFKDINIDTLNKDILEGLKPKLTSLSKFAGGKGLTKSLVPQYDPSAGPRGVTQKEVISQTKEYSDALENVGMAVKAVLTNLSLLQKEGKVTGAQINESFTVLMSNIKTQAGDAATQILLMNKALAGFDNEIAVAAAGTDDLTKKTKLMQAAMLGAIIPAGILQGYLSGGGGRPGAGAYFEKQIDDAIAAATELQTKLYKAVQGTKEIPDASKEDSALTKLKKQTKEIQTQTKVFRELRKAGVDAATAQELAANVDLAKQLNATKFLGNNWKNAVASIKDYAKKQQQLEKTIAVGGGAGEYQQYLFKKAEAFISLQEQLIDMQYKSQLKGIETQTQALNTQLENIKVQEDQINEKFDKQIGALNTIKTLNENIANQEKQRLTIADALSRGDISAAAVAVQEARSQQASASMEAAQQGLTTGRENAIAALGAKTIQKQIDALNKQKDVIEETITKQKESIKYFGMTADQIRDAARALDLANDAGMDINNPTFLNNLLKGATGDATALGTVMVTLQTEARNLFAELQALRDIFLTTGGGAGGVGVGFAGGPGDIGATTKTGAKTSSITVTAKSGQTLSSIAKANKTTVSAILSANPKFTQDSKYKGGSTIFSGTKVKIPGKMYGGIVAGNGMLDKVPTMLTPGEFVVNKNAAKRFGPLLHSINESKYPGLLSPMSGSSLVGMSSNSINNNSSSVYNYSLNIDASGGSASPSDIARIVMTQIKNMDAQRIRGNRY